MLFAYRPLSLQEISAAMKVNIGEQRLKMHAELSPSGDKLQ
jgi:hypothetical protein